ncbi:MAG: preprotein translocase subunit SecG [Alphaproteobacteria bacterium]|nr:preprotein translocase subunit SecG [Alphaproteobacteria bacterium]
MSTILLVIHLLIAIALVGVILVQRSEGGGLGIGGSGGGGMGGFMTGRDTANLLTRTTAVLAALFFATSITLAILASRTGDSGSVVREPVGTTAPPAGEAPSAPAVPSVPSPPTNDQ